ncbi:MAG: NAD-dependent epimerase/dehydratase family protein [Lachnospiraceae bacterium]|nr:NAD-dependent epimerase/dehydratase family protein [Lachnospiraceae bacterium]
MVELRDIDIILRNPIDWEKFRNKTVLVTGATGRLGMYIVEAINKADIDWNLNITIIALARNEKKLKEVFGESLKLPNIHGLIQDITAPIIWDGDVHYIFHTAGLASPQDFTNCPVDTLWGHVQGTRNVLELAKNKKSEKVLYVSTVEIYGEWKAQEGIREEDMGIMHCSNARACYPEAKRLCETMFASYEAQYGVSYVGVRLCHTFGPGISLDDGRAFSEFLSSVIQGKNIMLQTDGSAVRTYTYVADAIGAMLLVFTKGKEHFYNIANINNLISIRDLANLIAGLDAQKKVKVLFENKEGKRLRYLPFKLGIMNVDKVTALGWKPQVGLEDAFRYTLESFQQRNDAK